MRRRKTFREKLEEVKDLPRIVPIPEGMSRTWGKGTMVLSAAAEVAHFMRVAPKGRLVTINQIRETLASRHGATYACPIVTGLMARIVAGAAGEDEAEGKKRVTPYWRTLKTGGELNAKYPGGLKGQRKRLESEGHRVEAKGKRLFVRDYERSLVRTPQ
ncbi:MAG: MGMT family protein [Candidatus Eiseniibacteriota bacterium]|nr:MAG: MGMT family protein [Candidatus Eisenbacteria bacterium]